MTEAHVYVETTEKSAWRTALRSVVPLRRMIDEVVDPRRPTTALAGGVLNSYERFAIPAFSSVLLNLIMIIALNHPELPLKEAILHASEIVRSLLIELIALIDSIKIKTKTFTQMYPAHASKLNTHLSGVVRCVQAIWMWHCHSKRYKRPVSLWMETRLVSETVAKGI